MSDAIVLDVLSSSPVQLDAGDADPIAREEIAALATRVTTVEGDVSGLSTRMGAVEGDVTALDGRMDAAEGDISTLGTTVDGIDARVEAIEADYVTAEDVMGALGGEAPALVSGSSRAMLGDPETASWMGRTTAADGAALIESVNGNTLRWNQLTGTSPDEVTEQITGRFTTPRVYICNVGKKAGHKYLCSLEAKVSAPSTMTFEMYLSDDHVETVVSQRVTETTSYVRRAYIFTVTQDYAISNFGYRNFTYVEGEDVSLSTRNGFCVDLTAMFGAGNEPATVAEFEALFPKPHYPYDAGSLLPVRMEGIETVGFNLWDEQWINGNINEDGTPSTYAGGPVRSKNHIPVFPSTTYYCKQFAASNQTLYSIYCYDADKSYIGIVNYSADGTFTTLAGTHYIMFRMYTAYGTAYNHDICINLSDPSRNGEYEPYWSAQRPIPVATYFPDGMRSAGSVRDELTATQAITRVGEVDLGTLYWYRQKHSTDDMYRFRAAISGAKIYNTASQTINEFSTTLNYAITSVNGTFTADDSMALGGDSSTTYFYVRDDSYTDAAAFKAAMSGVMLHYALATPTTTPIDPPLNLSYRTGAGGTERVMVASGTMSAPPIFATRYPLDPADLAASIAPRESATAKTNHQVGDLLMLGFTLCKATQVIVTGETIEIGTNVTRTSVAAELAALSE